MTLCYEDGPQADRPTTQAMPNFAAPSDTATLVSSMLVEHYEITRRTQPSHEAPGIAKRAREWGCKGF